MSGSRSINVRSNWRSRAMVSSARLRSVMSWRMQCVCWKLPSFLCPMRPSKAMNLRSGVAQGGHPCFIHLDKAAVGIERLVTERSLLEQIDEALLTFPQCLPGLVAGDLCLLALFHFPFPSLQQTPQHLMQKTSRQNH